MNFESKLWGETIVYDVRAILLQELQQEYQNKAKMDLENIIQLRRRQEGTYLRKIKIGLIPSIKATAPLTQKILDKYSIDYHPNWDFFNLEWEERIEKIIQDSYQFSHISWYNQTKGDIHGQENLRRNYRKAMSESEGLGWGIITNSMADAIWYTIVSTCHDVENQKKSWEYASKAQDDFFDTALNAHNDALDENFDNTTFPEIVEMFGDYYTAVVNLIKDGLGIVDEADVLFNISASNEQLNKPSVTKTDIINAIKCHPANGNVFIVALRNDLLDEELINFLSSSGKTMLDSIYQNIKEILMESFLKCNLHNSNFAESNISDIVKNASYFYEISNNKNTWKTLIYDVYGEVLKKVEKKFRYIKSLYDSKEILRDEIIKNGDAFLTTATSLINSIDKRILIEFYEDFKVIDIKQYVPSLFLNNESLVESINIYLDETSNIIQSEILLIEKEKAEKRIKINKINEEIRKFEKELEMLGFVLFGKKKREKERIKKEIEDLKIELMRLK